eukprot:CAMPEP_0170059668 /NCGR_PEP_ID=MMETSP0019_2-20121128/1866_1 /TAXON_ID=98059 /ORGANISM="Dinobryon sp., Strain UTEXLB2267" /LENGTH=325 /DNA_ID=CAMNT_0010264989 /DNA_START=470 /DNA_END=1447 /DNA_ORIENTATION=-
MPSNSESVPPVVTVENRKSKRKQDSLSDSTKRARVDDSSNSKTTVEVSSTKPTVAVTETVDIPPKYMVQVRNLPFSATENEVEEHIRNCFTSPDELAVLSCRLLLSKTGTPRGVANIELRTEDDFQKLLSLNGSNFQSRQMIVESLESVMAREAVEALKNKKLAATAAALKSAGSAPAPHLTTVYVSKLPLEVTDGDLRAHFSSCGSILSAKVSLDKKTGVRKGFGFVQFHEEAAKQAALLLNKSVLQDAQISVTPSRYSLVSPPAVVNNTDEVKIDSNMEVDTTDNTIEKKDKDVTKQDTRATKINSTVLAFKPRGMVKKNVAK